MKSLARFAVCLALCAACKDRADAPPPAPVPAMSAAEIKRAQDACQSYVDKACACAQTVPAMQSSCKLARALPDAIQLDLAVSASAEAKRRDALWAQDSMRKIVKECIEGLARLPAAGCP